MSADDTEIVTSPLYVSAVAALLITIKICIPVLLIILIIHIILAIRWMLIKILSGVINVLEFHHVSTLTALEKKARYEGYLNNAIMV